MIPISRILKEGQCTPVITAKPRRKLSQIRFWGSKEEYRQFVIACRKNGFLIQDIFSDLMKWFIKNYG